MFVLRTTKITLSDLVVEGCLFAVSGALESVIGVEKCNSELARGTVRLHRIGFRENRFSGGAVAIQANASSCSKLEIEDLDFHTNTCNGVCGLFLAKENRLQNINIGQNRPMSSLHSRSTLVLAPPQSLTFADGIKALENSCTIFSVEGGSFHLSNSNFTKNSVTGEGDESISACIQLKDASASIRDCSFEENESGCGVAVHARKTELSVTRLSCVQNKAGLNGGCLYVDVLSSLKMSDSVLEGNRARSGGALFFRNASAVIVNSKFLSNRADDHGGDIRSIGSHIVANELTADGNRAEAGGGSVSITSKSTLTVHDSVFKNGASHIGGAVEESGNSVGKFVNVTFVNNVADEAGGSVYASNATLIILDSRFRDGGAPQQYSSLAGGLLSAANNSLVVIKHATMTDGIAGEGGAIELRDSIIKAEQLNVSTCTSWNGGAIHLSDSYFKAEQLNVSNCTAFWRGGGIHLSYSYFEAEQLNVSKCSADSHGGAVNAEGSEFLCTNCLFASNTVKSLYNGGYGGAISITRDQHNRSATQLQESRILNNSARFGGESPEIMHRWSSFIVFCRWTLFL